MTVVSDSKSPCSPGSGGKETGARGGAGPVALVYPPTCDPTAPYLSLPSLAGRLRAAGIPVLPMDANVEAWDALLRKGVMERVCERIRRDFRKLDGRPFLDHRARLHLVRLWEVSGDLAWVPGAVEDAVQVLRDPARFYNGPDYERAVQTVQAALRLIGAAYHPLAVDFTSYRTPFSLLSPDRIREDARPDLNPFHETYKAVGDRIEQEGVALAGISLAFPGQVQPGFTLAWYLRERFPDLHLTVGGPALTQLLVRHDPENQDRILGPFDTAVLYEGEEALERLVLDLAGGARPRGIISGRTDTPLRDLPPPDFDGLPLDLYFSPAPVLPYDPTRGCYWGRCAFCHYGLCREGTARYRQRRIGDMVEHLGILKSRWGCRNVYLSQDAFRPATARRLARALIDAGLEIRWSTDMRPEPALDAETCRDLREGGALSMALGIESASSRVLALIDKGISVADTEAAVRKLSGAGIAVEAMCFNAFPTETPDEAMATLGFVRALKERISLFICGRFGLWHGSRVPLHPSLVPDPGSPLGRRYDLARLQPRVHDDEARIWATLIEEMERVGPGPYQELAAGLPRVFPGKPGKGRRTRRPHR